MLPVETEHVGWVTVPITITEGTTGCEFITTFPDAADVHPDAFVTVNACVPVINPEMVLLIPVPEIAPGFIVQFPVGNPFNTTLPVDSEQVGCVIVPTVGADGVAG